MSTDPHPQPSSTGATLAPPATHSATDGAPQPAAPPADHAPRLIVARPRRTAWWLTASSVVAIAVAALVVAGRNAQGVVPAAPSADVPRLEAGKLTFSQRFRERAGIRMGDVRHAALTPSVSAVGTVTFDPKHVSDVGTRLEGLVRVVRRFEGDQVKKGEILAEIDSPELGEAQASVTMLRASRAAAKLNADRENALVERKLSTAREAEDARAELSRTSSQLRAASQRVSALTGGGQSGGLGVHRLASPLDGTVVERRISAGQSVGSDHTAFRVANLAQLWVELAVFEKSLPAIKLGDRVEIRPLNSTDHVLEGKVAHVGFVIDPETRSAAVRIEVDNRERHLRPGQAVDATIHGTGTALTDATLVPNGAITYVDGRPVVFVAESDTVVHPVDVVLGQSNGADRHVVSGLTPGQRVVIEGLFALKSELYR